MTLGLKEKVTKFPLYVLYAIVPLLPWQARYFVSIGELHSDFWEYATISIYIIDIAILILLLLVLYTKDKASVKYLSKVITAILVVVAYLLLQQATSSFQLTAPTGALYITFVVLWLMSLVLISWERKKIILGLMLAGLWSGALGAIQFYYGDVHAYTFLGVAGQNPYKLGVSVIQNDGVRLLRSYGSLSHPNMLGGLLALSVLSSIALYGTYKQKLKNILVLACMTFLSAMLFITFSRSAILGLSIGILVVGFFIVKNGTKLERRYYLKSVLVVSIIFITFISIFSNEVSSRFSNNRLETQSITERTASVPEARSLFQKYSIFGTGFNTYSEALAYEDDFHGHAWEYQPVHNVGLLSLVQFGIVGTVILGLLLLQYIVQLFSRPIEEDQMYMVGMLVIVATISMFDHYFLSSHFGLLLGVLIFTLAQQKRA